MAWVTRTGWVSEASTVVVVVVVLFFFFIFVFFFFIFFVFFLVLFVCVFFFLFFFFFFLGLAYPFGQATPLETKGPAASVNHLLNIAQSLFSYSCSISECSPVRPCEVWSLNSQGWMLPGWGSRCWGHLPWLSLICLPKMVGISEKRHPEVAIHVEEPSTEWCQLHLFLLWTAWKPCGLKIMINQVRERYLSLLVGINIHKAGKILETVCQTSAVKDGQWCCFISTGTT